VFLFVGVCCLVVLFVVGLGGVWCGVWWCGWCCLFVGVLVWGVGVLFLWWLWCFWVGVSGFLWVCVGGCGGVVFFVVVVWGLVGGVVCFVVFWVFVVCWCVLCVFYAGSACGLVVDLRNLGFSFLLGWPSGWFCSRSFA
ncbi:hypothetical protein RA272_28025, partial [Pseudomonas syringae pv. tagetis]|uniref:hypothetical protein n=1 Tax=Pseudomonas syringae group genomosp. 7 TaxID=251699 RepID=UPI00376F9B85